MGGGTNGLEGRSYQGIGLAARKHGKDIVIAFLAVLCIAFGALWTRAQREVNAFATRATSGYDVVGTYESPSHGVGGYSHGAYASLAILHPERDGMGWQLTLSDRQLNGTVRTTDDPNVYELLDASGKAAGTIHLAYAYTAFGRTDGAAYVTLSDGGSVELEKTSDVPATQEWSPEDAGGAQ